MMFRARVFRDVLVGGAMLAFAAPVFAAPPSAKAQYDHCLARAATNGNDALREATLWQESGGGPAADHCMAVALVTLHRYGEAATKLDALARGGFASDPAMRAALFDQAGNAWLLADNPDSAITSFTAALAIDPSDADLLADRARANAVKKLWARADSDLSAALLVDPDRADLLVLRGSARHAMGRKAEARADFEGALKIRRGLADALVERGMMKLESGDVAGARADWSQVVAAAPGTVAGEAARRHLQEIEAAAKPVGKKPKPAPKAR